VVLVGFASAVFSVPRRFLCLKGLKHPFFFRLPKTLYVPLASPFRYVLHQESQGQARPCTGFEQTPPFPLAAWTLFFSPPKRGGLFMQFLGSSFSQTFLRDKPTGESLNLPRETCLVPSPKPCGCSFFAHNLESFRSPLYGRPRCINLVVFALKGIL